ncbi:MAG: hypothetical protein ACTSU2_11375 [Promethearchaeota archaeon]
MAEENEKTGEENIEHGTSYKRLRWVDSARGFVMFYLVFTLFFPPEDWRKQEFNSVIYFLFNHAGTQDKYMTLYDVGAAAFIFVLGLMMAVSYKRHIDKEGKAGALKHLVIRYLYMTLLSVVLIFVFYQGFIKHDDAGNIVSISGIPVIYWDVVPAITVAGFVSIPFLLIKDWKKRMAAGYIWAIIYQLLMNFAGLKDYAKASVHGGIFGSIFGYAAISIVASALGEYAALSPDGAKEKYKNIALFGLANLIIGLAIAIPSMFTDLGWEAAKRQVSFTHDLISIGVTVLGMMVFIYIDQFKGKRIHLLEAFGANTFMSYFIGELIEVLLEETVGVDLGLGWAGNLVSLAIGLGIVIAVEWSLYKKGKVISTPKVAVIMAITILALGIPLMFL